MLSALRLAIELFSQRGKFCEAGDLATQLAELDPQNAAMILIRGFDWHLRCGDFTAAESNLNRAVELAPDNAQVRRLLAQLLNAQGRRYEASEHVRQLLRLRAAESEEVLSLIDLSGPFLLVSFADFTDDTDVSLFSLGKARYLYVKMNAEPQEVLLLLDRVTEKFPNSTAAAAFRGRVLAETAASHRIQVVADEVAGRNGRATGVLECDRDVVGTGELVIRKPSAFGEALRRDPGDRQSLRAMIRALELTENEAQTPKLRDRLAVLDQIFRNRQGS